MPGQKPLILNSGQIERLSSNDFISFDNPLALPTFALANLPSASNWQNAFLYCTDYYETGLGDFLQSRNFPTLGWCWTPLFPNDYPQSKVCLFNYGNKAKTLTNAYANNTYFEGFTFQNNGAGSGLNATHVPGNNSEEIAMVLATGSTTTGRAGLLTGRAGPNNRNNYCKIKFQLSALRDVTDEYTIRLGFGDNLGSESTDGVFFKYSSASTAFEAITRNNNSETVQNTGITVNAGQDYILEIVINPTYTAYFYINGTLVATINTNVPSSAGTRQYNFMPAYIQKSAGTNSRLLRLYYGYCLAGF